MTSAHHIGNNEPPITGDELARMPNHDSSELIDGRIVSMSPTNPEHGRIEANIAGAIGAFVRTQNLGLVMTGEVGIFTATNPDRVRGADVVFISHARYESRPRTRGFLDIAPELIVEILSPENAHIDTQQKVREYLAIGVQLVLVADPVGCAITAHRATGQIEKFGRGESVPCENALPGFALSVAAAFD
jgi:Uma2 family endonuclease